MTELHERHVSSGRNEEVKALDNFSYRQLLKNVPRNLIGVLELGSASGGQWDILREWGSNIAGIDLYEPEVLEAQKRGLPISVGFVENMVMFPAESFQLVCSRHVMEHLGNVDSGIEEINRVLIHGGYSAHVTPDIPGDNEPSHLNKWNLDQWVEKWVGHGFTLVNAQKYPFHGGEVHIVCRKPL